MPSFKIQRGPWSPRPLSDAHVSQDLQMDYVFLVLNHVMYRKPSWQNVSFQHETNFRQR